MKKVLHSESPEFHFCTRHACEHGWESECRAFEHQGRPCMTHAKANRKQKNSSAPVSRNHHDRDDRDENEKADEQLLHEIFGTY